MDTIDAALVRQRFSRALQTYDEQAHAQRRISRRLAALLAQEVGTEFDRLLEIGCGSGDFTRVLRQQCHATEWVLNDLCDACREAVLPLFADSRPPRFVAGNAEEVALPGLFDLVASASAFQWMQDMPRFFAKLAEALRPGGLLAFSTFAPGNLAEIKTLTGCGLAYPAASQLREWMAPHFRMLYEEEESIGLSFATPTDVLRHLKHTGVTATSSGVWTRGRQEEFCRNYRLLFSAADKQQVALTYRPLYMLAVKE